MPSKQLAPLTRPTKVDVVTLAPAHFAIPAGMIATPHTDIGKATSLFGRFPLNISVSSYC